MPFTFCVWVIILELWHLFCRHSIICKCHYRTICFLNFLFLLSHITCLVCSVCLTWLSERECSTFTFCFCGYYFTRWKLQVNIHKTEAIFFTRCHSVPPVPLHFQHTVIPWNLQVRYLGLLLDPKFLFTRHLTSVTHNATASSSKSSLSSHAI
jgi:hypothetical protein